VAGTPRQVTLRMVTVSMPAAWRPGRPSAVPGRELPRGLSLTGGPGGRTTGLPGSSGRSLDIGNQVFPGGWRLEQRRRTT